MRPGYVCLHSFEGLGDERASNLSRLFYVGADGSALMVADRSLHIKRSIFPLDLCGGLGLKIQDGDPPFCRLFSASQRKQLRLNTFPRGSRSPSASDDDAVVVEPSFAQTLYKSSLMSPY